MIRKCEFCGAELLGNNNFCPTCGKVINQNKEGESVIKSSQKKLSDEIIADIKNSQKPLKTIEEIKTIIGYGKKRVKIDWNRVKIIMLLLLIANITLFIAMMLMGGRGVIPIEVVQIFYPISFILSFILLCICSISMFKGDKFSTGINWMIYKEYEKAINSFIKVLKSNPEEINVWRGLGYLYDDVNEHNEAIKACKIGLELDSNDTILWWILASVYTKVGDDQKANEAWDHLTEFTSDGEVSIEIKGVYPYFRLLKKRSI